MTSMSRRRKLRGSEGLEALPIAATWPKETRAVVTEADQGGSPLSTDSIGRMSRLWQFINAAALLLGLFVSIVSILAFFKVGEVEDDLEALITEAKKWQVTISLAEPQNGTKVEGFVTRIAGSVDLRTTAAEVKSPPSMNLALQDKRVELVPFVRPLSESKWWWAQADPVIRQDGGYEGSVFIGEKTRAGIGVDFQLIVLAVPQGTVTEGDRVSNLPFFYAASNTVTIRRVR